MVYSDAKLVARSLFFSLVLLFSLLFGFLATYLVLYLSGSGLGDVLVGIQEATPIQPSSAFSFSSFFVLSKKLCAPVLFQVVVLFIATYTMFSRALSLFLIALRGAILGLTLWVFVSPVKWWWAYALTTLLLCGFCLFCDMISRRIGFMDKTRRMMLVGLHVIAAFFVIGLSILLQMLLIYVFP